jgi:transketolase
MRKALVSTLVELAESDDRLMLLTADLGFMALEPFAEKFPDRFINVGVAEENMVGVATGLAEAGFIPFVYSIVTFACLRPYEFIRNGPVQHRLPVRVVGVGGGVGYGQNGLSHYGLEDIGVMRLQPGMRVVAPADNQQVNACIRATWQEQIPVYYRIEKENTPVIPGLDGRFETGRVQVVRHGTDCLLLSMGGISSEVSEATVLLKEHGIECAHGVISDINPPPREHLCELLGKYGLVFAIEVHYRCGGIGSLVAETIAEAGLPCRLWRLGFASTPAGLIGSQTYLWSRNGLDRKGIAATVLREIP